MSTRKKRTTVNFSRGASSSLDEELNTSNLLTRGEELPKSNVTQPWANQDPNASTAKAAYEAELAKLRKETEELAKTKKKLLAIQQEAEAAKEIQRHKVEIAKLQEELRTIKAKQSLSFNQPRSNIPFPINPHSQRATYLLLNPSVHHFQSQSFCQPFRLWPFEP
jgi:hypothetical protein